MTFSFPLRGVLSIGLAASGIGAPVTVKTIPRDPSVVALSTDALIDRLQEEAPGDPERRWPAMVIAFQPLDASQRFEQNLPRDPRSPVMTELIRRGVDAVPLLLHHLTDTRLTRLVEHHQAMMNDGGMWFDDVYDPRNADAEFSPPVNHEVDFKTTRALKVGESYTVKVGDLCFFALGQIVDRQLLVFGGVIKDGGVWARSRSINSPIEFPALATAARTDWTGINREEHKRLLETTAWENDALGTRPGRCYGALQRLLFYYPEDGRRVAADLLRRPLVIDYGDITTIAQELEQETREQQMTTVASFRRSHDADTIDALHRLVARDLRRLRIERDAGARRSNLTTALISCFPDHKIEPRDRIREVTARDQAELVETLEPFDWPELPSALVELFERASGASATALGSRMDRDRLLLVCAKRLKGSPQFEACAKVLAGEITELSANLRMAEAAPPERPGRAPDLYRIYRYSLNIWLKDAATLIAGR
jgi:hypothetical protein